LQSFHSFYSVLMKSIIGLQAARHLAGCDCYAGSIQTAGLAPEAWAIQKHYARTDV
jgi:hypothetical protein